MSLAAALLLLSLASASRNSNPAGAPARDSVAVLVGAGDIASCSFDHDEATARLLDSIPGTVFTAGDNVYSSGTPDQFTRCYAPTWGRHKARTKPVPGNHDYTTSAARVPRPRASNSPRPSLRRELVIAVGSWPRRSSCLRSPVATRLPSWRLSGDGSSVVWCRFLHSLAVSRT